jgi:hypothetical protein
VVCAFCGFERNRFALPPPKTRIAAFLRCEGVREMDVFWAIFRGGIFSNHERWLIGQSTLRNPSIGRQGLVVAQNCAAHEMLRVLQRADAIRAFARRNDADFGKFNRCEMAGA